MSRMLPGKRNTRKRTKKGSGIKMQKTGVLDRFRTDVKLWFGWCGNQNSCRGVVSGLKG